MTNLLINAKIITIIIIEVKKLSLNDLIFRKRFDF